MHTPWIRIFEITLYTLINTVPYHLCCLYPFRKKLRYSLLLNLAIILVATVIEFILNLLVGFHRIENSSLVTQIWSLTYILAYCLVIKDHPGKVCFWLLLLLNVANFNVVATKAIENFFFPRFAVERYHFSASLIMIGVVLLVVIPFFFFVKKVMTPALNRKSTGALWLYSWMVPFTFYFLWHYHIHFNASTSLEVAGDPHTTMFLLVINICAMVIYYIVAKALNEADHNLQLRATNHQLALQTVQYENLHERIQETRKANHDLRHHITAMSNYLEQKDYEGLHAYFRAFQKHLPGNTPMAYTPHNSINMLLAYFAQIAQENQIRFDVKMDIPKNLPVSDSDLTVLLGNLVENAVEACIAQKDGDRVIRICGQLTGSDLLFTIDNTFDNPLRKNPSGVFLSSKHSGEGIGLESARSIANRLGGYLEVAQQDAFFCVSIVIRT